MGAVIVVDAFWGDSGKGKIAAYLARRLGATYGVRAGTGTNAGHSVYMEDGKLLKLNQLPAALVEKESQVRVGSGVAVDPEIFLRELDEYDACLLAQLESSAVPRDAVSRALLCRYLKRITAHAMNVITSLVMPVDRLDYYDEDKADRE